MAGINGKLCVVVAFLMVCCLLALSGLAAAETVFVDSFSSDSFSSWTESIVGAGSSQTVTDGIARFIVPTPGAQPCTYSFVKKDGFTSTVNSMIIASQDIYLTKVPNGSPQGNGAIFFFYLCDSTDLSGKKGNFGVGIDGSQVWSLWIGSNTTYTYLYQTGGSKPLSNVWYRVVLAVDNGAGTVSLAINGSVVISAGQHEFTDGTHPVTLMSGMGEDWWTGGFGLQEIDVDNVSLFISDMAAPSASPTPAPTPTPTPSTPNPTQQPQPTSAPNSTPNTTAKPTTPSTPQPSPANTPSPIPTVTPTAIQGTSNGHPLWAVLSLTLVLAVVAAALFMLKKR